MVTITVAKSAGFCFGVKRAIDLAQDIASKNKEVYTFGPLIHNPQEVERLEKENIKVVEDFSKIKEGVLVLRTHGIPLDIYENLSKKENIKIDVVEFELALAVHAALVGFPEHRRGELPLSYPFGAVFKLLFCGRADIFHPENR